MATTLRQVLQQKLESFYQKHDPVKLQRSLDTVVNYAMTEGIEALNAGLMAKYGDHLDSNAGNTPEADRNGIRRRVEMFYLKHEPEKLEKAADIEAVVEWTLLYGVAKLNDKLKLKYGEILSDATEEDAIAQLKKYYASIKITKTENDYLALLEWSSHNSFCALSTRLKNKYLRGLSSIDGKKRRDDLTNKIKAFYKKFDEKQLDDQDNLEFIVNWTLNHGEESLNERLRGKYDSDLATFQPHPPTQPNAETAETPDAEADAENPTTTEENDNEPENEEEKVEHVITEEEEVNRWRVLCNYFYAKHDQDKLYGGSATVLLEKVLQGKIDQVNLALKEEFDQDLSDLEKEHAALKVKLAQFYGLYDPERLARPLESLIGWAIVHGVEKFNEKLINKYDDDLDATGLKRRLKVFYKKVHEPRSDTEIEEIATWTFKKGLQKLNKRMKRKYGESLDSMFFNNDDEVASESFAQKQQREEKEKTQHKSLTPPAKSMETFASYNDKHFEDNAQPAAEGSFRTERPELLPSVVKDPAAHRRSNSTTKQIVAVYMGDEAEEGSQVNVQEEEKGEQAVEETLEGEQSVHSGETEEMIVIHKGEKKEAKRGTGSNRSSTLARKPTRRVTRLETERQKTIKTEEEEQQEQSEYENITQFTPDDLDYKKANRRSLKQLRQSQRRTQHISSPVNIGIAPADGITKLGRFLDHIEDYRGNEDPKKEEDVEIRNNPSGSFSYKMNADDSGAVVQENLRLKDIQNKKSERVSGFDEAVAVAKDGVRRSYGLEDSLVHKLQRFYNRHDHVKAKNGKTIRANIEFVLSHGVESFNKLLMDKYGESLNSVDRPEKKRHSSAKLANMAIAPQKSTSMALMDLPQKEREDLDEVV